MKIKRKGKLPSWLLLLIDTLLIAAYILSFYKVYYLSPRQLTSASIKTVQAAASSSGTSGSETAESDASSGSDTSSGSDALSGSNSSNGTDTTNGTDTANGSKTANGSSTTTDSDTTADASTSTTADSSSATSSGSSSSSDWAVKFADHFTDTVVSTDNSYSSSDISITVNKYTEGSGSDLVTYYVADIYLANIECLQSGFADDTYGVGYTDTVLNMDKSLSAILAMNGDYYGNGGTGVVIRNGEVYRTTTSGSDVCVLYYDGTMKTFSADEFDINQAIEDGAWQAWCFGPELLDEDGNSLTSFTADGHVSQINPRSAIGYYEPGHYCLVVVDGRQSGYSQGMTLTQLSTLFKQLGCTSAYNLDGGKSSEMTFNDSLVNQPCDGGREVSDCVFIKEVE